MIYPYLPYAITELFCIVFAIAILFRMNGSIGSQHEIAQLKRMVYTFIVMVSSDIFWALNCDGIIMLDRLPNALDNAITLMAITLGCFFWFLYVEDHLHKNFERTKLQTFLVALPAIIVCVLDTASIFTSWIFYIDANNQYQVNDTLFIIPSIVNYGYLLVPSVEAIWLAIKSNSKTRRREYLFYPAYIFFPIVFSTLEDTFPNVPILALNIFAVILIFFLSIQSKQVSTDALTGLNNRRWLTLFLEKRLPAATAQSPVMLFIMDVNGFKAINDNYGHIEGDNALKSFATALRLAAVRYNAFIARYGADEFCMVVELPHSNPAEIEFNLIEMLQTVQSAIEPIERPYTLSASIGYAVCDHPEADVDAFIARANDVLRENKQTWQRNESGGQAL